MATGSTSTGSGSGFISVELTQRVIDIVIAILLLEGRLHVIGTDITRSGITLDVGGPALQLDVTTIVRI